MSAQLVLDETLAAARDCANSGRLAEAEELLAPVISAKPANGIARTIAGYVAHLRGDLDAAAGHFAAAVAAEPLLTDAHWLLGLALADLGRAEDACRALGRALALDPALAPARARLVEVLHARGRNDEARRVVERGAAHGFPQDALEQLPAAEAAPAASATQDGSAVGVAATRGVELTGATAGSGGPPDARPAAVDALPAAAVEWVDPREILHPRRMDVAAKYLYARRLLGEPPFHSGYAAEDVYLRHILFRTGGAEPGDEARKGSLAAFASQFARLVAAVKRHGFDAAHPIPVARRTGLLLNGAHRLAAAFAAGVERVPVTYDDTVDGLTWDHDWFVDQAFAPHEIDEIALAWIELQRERAGCAILWPAAEPAWDEIEAGIAARVQVAARRDFELAPHAFAELVRDLYVTDWGPVVGENIERKVAFLSAYAPRLRLLVLESPGGAGELATIKGDVRARFHHVVPADRFATIHTTAGPAETALVARTLLHAGTRAALGRRPAGGLRAEFQRWLGDYHAALGRLGIDPEDCCVVGSGALEPVGVRDATDLDFTVTHCVREARFTPGVTHVTAELDVVAKDYPRVLARAAAPGDDELIRDRALHFRVRGLKFAASEVVLARKQTQRRPKDLADVARIGRLRLAGRL